jgi:hypothetical protein
MGFVNWHDVGRLHTPARAELIQIRGPGLRKLEAVV